MVSFRALIFWQLFLIIASIASYYLRSISDSLLLYLPIAFSIILVHWYGWRMLIIIYINAVFTLFFWEAQGPLWRILLIATNQPLIAFISKFLVDRLIKIKPQDFFSSTKTFTLFILFGILVPSVVNSFYVYQYTFINGDLEQVALYWLSDFLTISSVSIPVLYFFKPVNHTFFEKSRPFPEFSKAGSRLPTRDSVEFFAALIAFVILYFLAPFEQFWFMYWIGAVIVALRQGFERAILISFTIFIINYILPLVTILPDQLIHSSSQQINVHLGSATMMFISLLVGRVVSDLHLTEESLVSQKSEIQKSNGKLSQTNQELDRFVYSVSHDLSAPLKSIKGLINISKLDPTSGSEYLDKMDKSVTKLESFIEEVLDYSRTNRKELIVEKIQLEVMVNEILEKFTFLEGFEKIKFVRDLKIQTIHSDKFLIKVILSNLISNAIKYQKKYEEHDPQIAILSDREGANISLIISDNGEGIRAENQENLFRMFYRGTTNSTGSGLGLYIAHEAAHKLGGTLKFKSVYGEGSIFTLWINDGLKG